MTARAHHIITVGVHSPHPGDPTDWYRGTGVLAYVPGIRVVAIGSDAEWAALVGIDVLLLLRPFHVQHQRLAALARDLGIPLWVDYDDDLFSVPADNPLHVQYSLSATHATISSICAMATVITVTTPALHAVMVPLARDVRVIPNAYNDHALGHTQARGKRASGALWRGSNTHVRDIVEIADKLVAISRAYPQIELAFLGWVPWPLDGRVHYRFVGGEAIPGYFRLLRDLAPKILMVPLRDCPFNRAKSNIAYIEASAAGAAVLAPPWDTWQHPGCGHYNGSFADGFAWLLAQDTQRLAKVAWESIADTLFLRRINSKRAALLSELMATRQEHP